MKQFLQLSSHHFLSLILSEEASKIDRNEYKSIEQLEDEQVRVRMRQHASTLQSLRWHFIRLPIVRQSLLYKLKLGTRLFFLNPYVQVDENVIESYRRKRRLELIAEQKKKDTQGGLKDILPIMFEEEITSTLASDILVLVFAPVLM